LHGVDCVDGGVNDDEGAVVLGSLIDSSFHPDPANLCLALSIPDLPTTHKHPAL
jgi:hypothetical protein